MIRTLIVDDEPVARRTIRLLLGPIEDVDVVAEAGNGEEALDLLTHEEIDLVFLDVQMPSLQGFDVLEALPEDVAPLIVFVTAYDAHAVKAFEYNAIDYLLKPFDDERFRATMERVRTRISERRLSGLGPDLRELATRLAFLHDPPPAHAREDGASDDGLANRLAIRHGRRIEFVDVAEIRWIEAEDYCVRLHTAKGSHLLRESLTRLEARLDPTAFVRVHRSAIVRIDAVRQFVPLDQGDGQVILHDGTRVRVSRTRRQIVNRVLGIA